MKPWQVKHLSFRRIAKLEKSFLDVVGLYSPQKKTVYVDSDLPTHCSGTRRSILEHENVHARLDHVGIKLRTQWEERFCALLGLAITPKEFQTLTEYELKRTVYHGLRWSNKKDRTRIIIVACAWAGIDHHKQFDKLAF